MLPTYFYSNNQKLFTISSEKIRKALCANKDKTIRNRRDRRDGNKIVVHITNRTVVGLPFVCRLFPIFILKGILAKGQFLYPVQVCHFLWMRNHFHIILAGRGKYISSFMNYIQGEMAKHVKRLCPGMFQSSVWAGRFKEQRLCTAESVINMIIYLYANPSRAGLVINISEWPGLSSWRMYREGSLVFKAPWMPSRKLAKLVGKIDHLIP